MTPNTDAQIHHNVLDELRWDSRVDEAHIGVQVYDGVVTLCGTVKTYAEKVAAVEAAHRVKDVQFVADELKVHGLEEITDTDIATAVRQALERHVSIPAHRIHTTVAGGVVTLAGELDTPAQREEAAEAIRNVRGMRAVIDEIALKYVTPSTVLN